MRMLAIKPYFPSASLIYSCSYIEISVLKSPPPKKKKKTKDDCVHFLMPKFIITSKSVNSSKQTVHNKHIFNLF